MATSSFHHGALKNATGGGHSCLLPPGTTAPPPDVLFPTPAITLQAIVEIIQIWCYLLMPHLLFALYAPQFCTICMFTVALCSCCRMHWNYPLGTIKLIAMLNTALGWHPVLGCTLPCPCSSRDRLWNPVTLLKTSGYRKWMDAPWIYKGAPLSTPAPMYSTSSIASESTIMFLDKLPQAFNLISEVKMNLTR